MNLLKWLKKLAPDLVSDSKIAFNKADSFKEVRAKDIEKAIIWTEGKTDVQHFQAALRWLREKSNSYEFELDFKEDLDKQNDAELLKACEQFCKHPQSIPMIAIFDRDSPAFVRQCHDDAMGFKDWKNGVYSFALPIPRHRQDENGICIELYYANEEIKQNDKSGRRIFLSNEFDCRSGRHIDPSIDLNTDRNKIKRDQLKIIDSDVFDKNHNNVALSKNNFARYIFEREDGFHDFNFTEFHEVFRTIEKVLEHYSN